MTETPAAHLARLRVQYGDRWRIDKNDSAYVARHRITGKRLMATTLPDLEAVLIAEAEWRASDDG
jgi:hypothetical protein